MREKLHDDFKKKSAIIKKEKIKNRDKLMAKVSSKALKEELKKKGRKPRSGK